MKIRYLKASLGLSMGLFLGGCGGGGNSADTGSPVPPPLVDGATVSFGVVTAFGSVFVNGVEFETDQASFDVDDNPGSSQDDLGVGDVVEIRGRSRSDGHGEAESVTTQDSVKGPISALDPAAGTLTVAGQAVITDAETFFDDNITCGSLACLAVGDRVRVAGFLGADQVVHATRIQKKPAFGEIKLRGQVTLLDPGLKLFNLRDLRVDYTAANLEGFSAAGIGDGDLVRVKGSIYREGVLQATQVERKSFRDDNDNDGDKRELEGLITRFESATDFDVSQRPVTTTQTTVYENGTAADLAAGLKVEVEGPLNAAGVLVARKVSIRRSARVRVSALVDSIDLDNRTLKVLGITIKVDALTRLEDKSPPRLRFFALADLAVGDRVEVSAAEFPLGSGELLARRLERTRADNLTQIQGRVTAVLSPTVTIFGVPVLTNSETDFGDDDSSLSSEAFFAQVKVGDLLKAKGRVTEPGVITAKELEFEDD